MDLSSHRPNHPTSTVPTPPTIDPAALEAALALVLPALAERQGAMLAVKDAQSGSYLWANERMAQWLGVSPDELPGRADADLLDAPLVTTLRAAEHTALAQGQPLTSEHRFERDGEKHDYRVLRLLTPPGADGRRLLCSVWTDQAVQKAKDAQLRAALEQLEQLQRNIETLRRELAHAGYAGLSGYFTREQPDLVITHTFWSALSGIHDLPAFVQGYVPVVIDDMQFWLRRDHLGTLRASPDWQARLLPGPSVLSALKAAKYGGKPEDLEQVQRHLQRHPGESLWAFVSR